MRSTFAAVVLLVAACTFCASAIRAPEVDFFQGGWNGTGTNCSASVNDSREVFVTFSSDPTHSYIVITTASPGGNLSSVASDVIQIASVIQARIDSYNTSSGYISFTNVWKGANGPRGCLRIIPIESAPHKKRHNGPHAVGIQLSQSTNYCTGDLNELPEVAEPQCGDNAMTTPRFLALELAAYPCNTPACGLLLGEYNGEARVSNPFSCSSTFTLTGSSLKVYNVSGRISAFAYIKGPIPGTDQPIPMVIRSYDSNTGQLQLQTFYSTRQCMTLNTTKLASGNFWASVPVFGDATSFMTCPAAGTGVTPCGTGVYDFTIAAPVGAPVAAVPSAATPTGAPKAAAPGSTSAPKASSASTVEIIVAYLTIAVVAVALVVLQ